MPQAFWRAEILRRDIDGSAENDAGPVGANEEKTGLGTKENRKRRKRHANALPIVDKSCGARRVSDYQAATL